MILEIAANSVASALAAQEGGAGRVELCSALELGGLTPSHAQITLVRDKLHIPLYVLIRPRAGDFLYSDLECETMRHDIEACAAAGCDGVVIGVLDADGKVDQERCRALMSAAGDLGVTFHRAFDLVSETSQALEDLVALGCERVLTSGGAASAIDASARINAMVAQAAGRMAVMPGAGITAANIIELASLTGAQEFHASAKQKLPSRMHYRHPLLEDMQLGELRSDVDAVRGIAAALQSIRASR